MKNPTFTKEWHDFYKILQVDPAAESEVVESAYKKLAQKYHPDKNKSPSAVEIMTKINEAYETLKVEDKRNQYNIKWLERQTFNNPASYKTLSAIDEMIAIKAKETMDRYFSAIFDKNFSLAYEYICNDDRKNISLSEFTKWQRMVSKVYMLISFDSLVEEAFKRKTLKKTLYEHVFSFKVEVTEKNIIMERRERDAFIKYAVFEDDGWRVFVGHNKVKELISRFERLSKLKNRKTFYLVKTSANMESQTGQLNKKKFEERLRIEVERFTRYQAVFSIALFTVEFRENSKKTYKFNLRETIIDEILQILKSNIRILDVLERIDSNTLVVLLPETTIEGAMQFRNKIMSLIQSHKKIEEDTFHIKNVIIENVFDNLQELVDAITQSTTD